MESSPYGTSEGSFLSLSWRCPLKQLLLKELVVVHGDRKVGECRKSLHGQ
ncbi:unnamed protein product [Musa acuminata subsp. malaccensis]|uniref:(wild Malaysian banana) hypothetical protein n=1 Tax=Musa acuminata subsp. malaccensis TaxID=214687 RepID=A0A804K5V6_MUSAM|nr:unnamed protein product [Musa acuminata subsp. malaccensis]